MRSAPKPFPVTDLGRKLLDFMVDHKSWSAPSLAYHFHTSEHAVLVELRKLTANGLVAGRKVRIGGLYVYDLTGTQPA